MKRTSLISVIRRACWIGAGTVFALVAILAYDTWDGRKKLERTIIKTEEIRYLQRIETDINVMELYVFNYFVNIRNVSLRSRDIGKWTAAEEELKESIIELENLATITDDKVLANFTVELRKVNKQSVDVFFKIQQSVDNLNHPVTMTDFERFAHSLDSAHENLDTIIHKIQTIVTRNINESEADGRALETELLVSMILSIILGIIAISVMLYSAELVPRKLKHSIKRLTSTVERVSLGNQSTPIESLGIEEFEEIESGIERMRISVNGMMERLIKG